VRRARLRLVAPVALGLLLTGCTSTASEDPRPEPAASAPAAPVLEPCPEQAGGPTEPGEALSTLAFDCPGGGTLDLARAPGVPTVVNLWGSWCTPCRDELPVFQEFADAAGDRVRVLGVISKDGVPQAQSFAADAGVTFPSAFDGEGELMADLGLNVLPFTAFLDADGRLVFSKLGPVESADELRGIVAEHLGVQL
jgi:cytochrome c biogenesis protein CcmG/thiol:disulfide interchange protein DsbE